MLKFCPKCKETKDVSNFHKSSATKSGLRCWCKSCSKSDNAKREKEYSQTRQSYRERHKARIKEDKQKYYQSKKEKILAKNAAWRKTVEGRRKSYTVAAKKRRIEWLLTDDEFLSFWQKPCFYCGSEIKTVGIDRVDSSQGYSLTNVVSCCSTCNRMKLTTGLIEFIRHILKINEHLGVLTKEGSLIKMQEILNKFNKNP